MWLFLLICAVLLGVGSWTNARTRARQNQHKAAVWERHYRRTTETKVAEWYERTRLANEAEAKKDRLNQQQRAFNLALEQSELDYKLRDDREAADFVRTQPIFFWALGLAGYAHTCTYLHNLARVSLQEGDLWGAMMCLWLKGQYKASFTRWCKLAPPVLNEPEEVMEAETPEQVQELVDEGQVGPTLPALPPEAEAVLEQNGEASPFAPLAPDELEGNPAPSTPSPDPKPTKIRPYKDKDGKWNWKRYWAKKDAERKRMTPTVEPL